MKWEGRGFICFLETSVILCNSEAGRRDVGLILWSASSKVLFLRDFRDADSGLGAGR